MFKNGVIYLLTIGVLLSAIQQIHGSDEKQCARRRPNRLFEQDFGLSLSDTDFLTSMFTPWMFRDYYRPWKHLTALSRDRGSSIKSEKDKFQINLDVQHFSPEEITVKTLDGYIVVEGRHEEKEDDHGFISRQFTRRYSLPEGVDPSSVLSSLSSDGVLTVTAPRKVLEGQDERVVPITRTGPVRKETVEDEPVTCEAGCD